MTLIKRNGFSNLPSMMEDFFKDDFFRFPAFATNWDKTIPSVNIRETDDNFELELAAPGMTREDFDIHLENNILTISSEKKEDKDVKEENYHRREFFYSSFKRSFTLPDSIDADHINAKYDNGILQVLLPKKEDAKVKPARTIEIG